MLVDFLKHLKILSCLYLFKREALKCWVEALLCWWELSASRISSRDYVILLEDPWISVCRCFFIGWIYLKGVLLSPSLWHEPGHQDSGSNGGGQYQAGLCGVPAVFTLCLAKNKATLSLSSKTVSVFLFGISAQRDNILASGEGLGECHIPINKLSLILPSFGMGLYPKLGSALCSKPKTSLAQALQRGNLCISAKDMVGAVA